MGSKWSIRFDLNDQLKINLILHTRLLSAFDSCINNFAYIIAARRNQIHVAVDARAAVHVV